MGFGKLCALAVLVTLVSCSPTGKPAFWKGTPFDSSVEEMRSLCAEDDAIACLKFKAITFLDSILRKDNFRITDNVEVSRNSYSVNEVTSRSSLEGTVENYIKTHDVTVKLPLMDSTVTLDARNLDNAEMNMKINYNTGAEARGKSKIKKILIPILVFVLLKAITLVPLALGILGLKAWNALQLSFFSFIVSVALAIFQLCKKIAADAAHPQISAHPPWEPALQHHYSARSLDEAEDKSGAQQLAYSAYAQQ